MHACRSTLEDPTPIQAFLVTLEPKATSTDDFATTVNQTTDSTNAERNLHNVAIRTGAISGMAGFIENGAHYETSVGSGIWKAGFTNNANGGVHPTEAAIQAATARMDLSALLAPISYSS